MRHPRSPWARVFATPLLVLGLIGALMLGTGCANLGVPFWHARLPRQRAPRVQHGHVVTGEPNWYVWALWLALRLRFVLRRGATHRDRDAAWRALDEFDAEIRAYEPRRWRYVPRDELG